MSIKISPAELVRQEGVEPPPNSRFQYVAFSDANGRYVRLRVMICGPDTDAPRGSIIFQPGRTEFIEKFFETANDLVGRGFNVLILDPRGQGLSSRLLDDRMKSWVDSFDSYADDLVFITNVFKDDLPKPHILMGHSMGGTIGLLAILTGRVNPSAAVFSSPMLEFQDMSTPFMAGLVKILAASGLKYKTLPFQAGRNGTPVPFISNKLTSDEARYKTWASYFENHENLRVGAPTFGWIAAAIKAMKFIRKNAEHLSIPSLIISCGGDPIVTPKSIEEFAKRSKAEHLNIPGALHEILLETDANRRIFWQKFDDFLQKNGL